MNNKKEGRVKILDCTVRDGGHLNNWQFDKKLVREIYRSVSKAGIDYFEIGYRSSTRDFDSIKYGPWKFSELKTIEEVCSNIQGSKISLMVDFGKIELRDIEPKSKSLVSLIRLAARKSDVDDALLMLSKIKEKGYEVSLQAMGFSSYSDSERQKFAKKIKKYKPDYLYVADSYGSIFPDQIREIFEPLLELKPIMKIGFHAHNSLQMAFANSIEAIKCGVDIVDGSIFGMGRGAGNLPTEIIIAYLQEKMPDKFNVIPVLNCIEKNFISMKKDIDWGYQLTYLLSGLFKCHPSYAKKIISLKEYAMEDIWKALDCISKKKPDEFSDDLVADIIKNGILGSSFHKLADKKKQDHNELKPSRKRITVNYLDRHKGKPFLVLGNGPTLAHYHKQIRNFVSKYKPIVLGSNYLGGLFDVDYHAFCNKRRFFDYIDTVSDKSTLMISQYISKKMVREYTDKPYEVINYVDTLNKDFHIVDGIIQCNCRSVSVLLMGIAIIMGADKIFAAGMDGYLNIAADGEPFFYKEHDRIEDREILIETHRWNNKFITQISDYLIESGKEEVHIITPTSYSKFYKGINNYLD
ncbi:aldolase catalytic domain-containing protein [Candidatus Omnitrophota bacterium]